MVESKRGREIVELVGFVVFIVLMSGLLTFLGLFVGRGLEDTESLQKVWFYLGVTAVFLIGVVSLKLYDVVSNRERPLFSGGFIHDPEKGVLGKLFSKYLSLKNVVFGSLFLFTIVGLFSVVTNTFFAGIPSFQQSITPMGRLILAVEPAVSSETLILMFLMSVSYGLISYFSRNRSDNVVLKLFLSVPLTTVFWVLFHSVRYGFSEVALLGTAVFGFVSALLIVLTGSFIPTYVFHFMNNFFLQAKSLFSTEIILSVSVFWLIILSAFLLIRRSLKKNRVITNVGG